MWLQTRVSIWACRHFASLAVVLAMVLFSGLRWCTSIWSALTGGSRDGKKREREREREVLCVSVAHGARHYRSPSRERTATALPNCTVHSGRVREWEGTAVPTLAKSKCHRRGMWQSSADTRPVHIEDRTDTTFHTRTHHHQLTAAYSTFFSFSFFFWQTVIIIIFFITTFSVNSIKGRERKRASNNKIYFFKF